MNNSPHLVIDASVVVAISANEPGRVRLAMDALKSYSERSFTRHAPQLVVMESLFVLCNKLHAGVLTQVEYSYALAILRSLFASISPPEDGDASLIDRAEVIRAGYGCSRSADSMYLALAEQLLASGAVELLTFDAGQEKQAAAAVPSITVNLLV